MRRLARDAPVDIVLFDLLWLDGHSLMGLPYERAARALEALELDGPSVADAADHVAATAPRC